MRLISRTDQSIIGRWWWTIDRITLAAILALMLFGLLLVATASPPVAERIGLDPFHFVRRQMLYLVPAAGLMLCCSLLSPRMVWRLASLVMTGTLVLLVATLLLGPETKGSTRWLEILGFSLQPSEFAKPTLAVIAAWLLARKAADEKFPGAALACGLGAVLATLLILQPDLGMTFMIGAILGAQIFLAGLPLALMLALGCLAVGGFVASIFFFDHARKRVGGFLNPENTDSYQISQSLEAFSKGGLFGTGPAQGNVKLALPDAHADFIFSVAGEEFGMVAGALLIGLYCFIILRSTGRALASKDPFIVLAVSGLCVQLGLQTLVHMGSSLRLLPAKGMTLPFISYGGSSLLAMGLGMGMLLALTRKQRTRTATSEKPATRQVMVADIARRGLS